MTDARHSDPSDEDYDDQANFGMYLREARSNALAAIAERLGVDEETAARKGGLSYRALSRELARRKIDASDQLIRQYHEGRVSLDRMEVAVVAFLASRYGYTVAELSTRMADRCEAVYKILSDANHVELVDRRKLAAPAGRVHRHAALVATPRHQQTQFSLGEFGRPVLAPEPVPVIVLCRCGDAHDLRADTEPCVYCAAPTFDEHRVCAQCRDLEALEEHAGSIIDLVAAHSQAG